MFPFQQMESLTANKLTSQRRMTKISVLSPFTIFFGGIIGVSLMCIIQVRDTSEKEFYAETKSSTVQNNREWLFSKDKSTLSKLQSQQTNFYWHNPSI